MSDSADHPIRLVILGWNTAGTGLTKVIYESFGPLTDQFDIHYVGIGYQGPERVSDGIRVYPTNLNGGDLYGTFATKDVISKVKPHILIVHQDVWYFENYMRHFGPLQSDLHVVAYVPLDGCFADSSLVKPLAQVDRLVAYTPWAQSEFQRAIEEVCSECGTPVPQIDTIGHGVDHGRYRPVESDRLKSLSVAKRRVFHDIADSDELFVVLNASRPTERKRIDITIRSFAQFAEDKPSNVRLCLHHAYAEEEHLQRIRDLASECQITDRLILNPLNQQGGPISEEKLNELYNACDIGINTSTGEGWGLVSFEHAATGAAQIVPSHSACGELWNNAAEVVPSARTLVPEYSPLKMSEVSVSGVASSLEKLYRDDVYRSELAIRGQQLAVSHRWESVAEKWRRILAGLVR